MPRTVDSTWAPTVLPCNRPNKSARGSGRSSFGGAKRKTTGAAHREKEEDLDRQDQECVPRKGNVRVSCEFQRFALTVRTHLSERAATGLTTTSKVQRKLASVGAASLRMTGAQLAQ